MYLHELPDWPNFHWNSDRLTEPLAAVRHRQGRLIGHMQALGFNLRQEAVLQTLTADVLKSSEIEGERLDATRQYDRPLSVARLFAWHASLFPIGTSGMTRIGTRAWRDDSTGPMQVVSGPIGMERVWMEWFLWRKSLKRIGCLGRPIDSAQTTLIAVLAKAALWDAASAWEINERQRLVLNRPIDGSEGKLTTAKYAKLSKCFQDSALRDIQMLVECGLPIRNSEGGRSTIYALARNMNFPSR